MPPLWLFIVLFYAVLALGAFVQGVAGALWRDAARSRTRDIRLVAAALLGRPERLYLYRIDRARFTRLPTRAHFRNRDGTAFAEMDFPRGERYEID